MINGTESGGGRPSVETGDLGREDKKPTEVVRIFVLQSKGKREIIDEIENGADLSTLNFTVVNLARKGSEAVNPNQITPVGGQITDADREKRGDLFAKDVATKRELLDEMHVRGFNLQEIARHSYEFDHPTRGRVKNEVIYVVEQILPTDEPYPLHPEEDKFHVDQPFVRLDLDTASDLVADGEIRFGDGQVGKILDSLEMDDDRRRVSSGVANTNTNSEDVGRVLLSLGEKWGDVESVKKIEIIKSIIRMRRKSNIKPGEVNSMADFEERLKEIKNVYDIQDLFKEFVETYGVSKEELIEAVGLSNVEEEIEHAGDSKPEVLLRFMYTLFMEKEWSKEYFDLAKKNPYIKEFLRHLKVFLNQILGNDWSSDGSLGSLHEGFEKIKDLYDENERGGNGTKVKDKDVRAKFEQAFELKHSSGKLSAFVNGFFTELADEAKQHQISRRHRMEEVSQFGSTANSSLLDLVKTAIYQPNDVKLKEKYETKSARKRAIFEARRKLVLMILADKFLTHYEDVTENLQNAPIHALWEEIIKSPIAEAKYLHKEYESENGERVLKNVFVTDSKDSDGDQLAVLRKIDLPSGQCYAENRDETQKTATSTFRKGIVRGYDDPSKIRDIYRRSIVLHSVDDASLMMTEVVDGEKYNDDYKGQKDVKAVFEIIEKLKVEGNVGGNRLEIVDYRPTGGGKVVGPGSKAKELSFAKFYVKHTDKSGNERWEEVHVYTKVPGDTKSAFYYHEKKQEDDIRYAMERLTETFGSRSFVELMHPVGVYGGTRNLYKKEGKGGKKKE